VNLAEVAHVHSVPVEKLLHASGVSRDSLPRAKFINDSFNLDVFEELGKV